jgi:hypothetical protein
MLKGIGFLFLLSFFSISQFYEKRQLWWLIIFIITIISIIMLLTRTLMAVSFIFLALFILRKSSYTKRILATIIIGGFVILLSQMNFFQILVDKTMIQTANLSDEIRIRSARFFLNEFSPNILAKIFGNGLPYQDNNYSNYIAYLGNSLGFYTSDLGYIGLYIQFGVFSIFAYFILIYKTFKISVPEKYLYCKYFLYFIFFKHYYR